MYRTNSLVNQMVAARAGIGLAALPCYLGDTGPGLVRALPDPVPDLARELWIVTHQDLRRTARVRAFFDTVVSGLKADWALIADGVAADQTHRGQSNSRREAIGYSAAAV